MMLSAGEGSLRWRSSSPCWHPLISGIMWEDYRADSLSLFRVLLCCFWEDLRRNRGAPHARHNKRSLCEKTVSRLPISGLLALPRVWGALCCLGRTARRLCPGQAHVIYDRLPATGRGLATEQASGGSAQRQSVTTTFACHVWVHLCVIGSSRMPR